MQGMADIKHELLFMLDQLDITINSSGLSVWTINNLQSRNERVRNQLNGRKYISQFFEFEVKYHIELIHEFINLGLFK